MQNFLGLLQKQSRHHAIFFFFAKLAINVIKNVYCVFYANNLGKNEILIYDKKEMRH